MPRPEVCGIKGVRGGVPPRDSEFRDRALEPEEAPAKPSKKAAPADDNEEDKSKKGKKEEAANKAREAEAGVTVTDARVSARKR